MQPLRKYCVVPRLPEKLLPLWDLAYNLLYAWNDEVADVFSSTSPRLWRKCRENPVLFLNSLEQNRIDTLSTDEAFLEKLERAHGTLRSYLESSRSKLDFPGHENGPSVAYFSFEYGLTPGLPIYSGGLGILAGDHLKSASDLGVPLVGIGLCYKEGYFRQYLTPDGWQQESYPRHDFNQLPIKPVEREDGSEVRFEMKLRGETLHVKLWRADVGRVPLYLMDCNLPENPDHLRALTDRLYGGDLELRLRQEFLLGVGGVRALSALNIAPRVIHMNEGHSAFAGLERIRILMAEDGLSYEAALEVVASSSVFTTHTPVPAGNDRFPPELMQPYFENYLPDLGLSWPVFLALGRENPRDQNEPFCMTVLALRLSRFCNGVSKLHGTVSSRMWKRVWPQFPVEDVPIGALTNGVHFPTWVSPSLAALYDKHIGPCWRDESRCAYGWDGARDISNDELWLAHERLRARLVAFVRMRLRKQLMDKGARTQEIEKAGKVLNPKALTIGFARRFATYKRANMIVSDVERLLRLMNDKDRPVQFIHAGKAHPADAEGKKLIQQLIELARHEECRMSMVFIEDYDMRVARHMVQGCDVWLNNPRRPLEACGTSGMKAMANGVLHFSTLDGWWAEAYQRDNSVGYAIGRGEEYEDKEYQDFVESHILFKVLEKDIIPDFYDRDQHGIPNAWVERMKKGVAELGPRFNSHRMVEDYVERAYRLAFNAHLQLEPEGFAPAVSLATWRMDLMTRWGQVQTRNVVAQACERTYAGEKIHVSIEVNPGDLTADDLSVELYHGKLDTGGDFVGRDTTCMEPGDQLPNGWIRFSGTLEPVTSGPFGFTVRVMPRHKLLLDSHSLGLIHWANEK